MRVAFFLEVSDKWLGGLNYFRNLINAITTYTASAITPVIFVDKNINYKLLDGFPDVEIIETESFNKWSVSWIKKRIIDNKILFKDRTLDGLCRKYKIDIVSHLSRVNGTTDIPTIGWIPDFQHIHLSNLFSLKEIKNRNRIFHDMCKYCTGILLSSYDAKKDLQNFAGINTNPTYVLQFVVDPPSSTNVSISDLETQYGFKGDFFYVPNQFWVHKNHQILLKALHSLKSKGRIVQIICTGNTVDYRNPNYFSTLQEYIRNHELQDQFIILGQVSYSHVITLERNCKALINPSLFEGWSTTVEESKSLGKKIILSDIPVHREQNPFGGEFFSPNNTEELAEKLWDIWTLPRAEVLSLQELEQENMNRKIQFAKNYEKIVYEILNTKGK